MKRIFCLLLSLILLNFMTACSSNSNKEQSSGSTPSEGSATSDNETSQENGGQIVTNENMQIQIKTKDDNIIVFQMNDSPAAKTFYDQLPLSIWVEDYADSEKIFYPPEKLDTDNTPMAKGPSGTLAYYAPWGNIAIFYEECKGADGLYGLGEIISGVEYLAEMTGEITIEKISNEKEDAPSETETFVNSNGETNSGESQNNTPTKEPQQNTEKTNNTTKPPLTDSSAKPENRPNSQPEVTQQPEITETEPEEDEMKANQIYIKIGETTLTDNLSES